MDNVDNGTKKRHSRTRAGCLSCRARKKKCDEVKPRCAGCRRNLLVCEWPSALRAQFERDTGGSPENAAGPAASSSRHSDPTNWLAGDTADAGLQLVAHAVPPATVKVPPPVPVPVLYAGSDAACSLTPQSVMLLSHYLSDTVSYFAMAPHTENPFVTVLLPLGYVDDLLMHGILALSGAHLSYKQPANRDLANSSTLHYSKLLGGLRNEFSTLRDDDLEKKERLLRVLIVACHHQATAGDKKGVTFKHLHACRHLILSLLGTDPRNNVSRPFNIDALGFSLELYTYLVLTNFLTPYGLIEKRTLPLDPFLSSLEDLSHFPTFGSLYAGSHGLFELMPAVAMLGSRRLAEEANGQLKPSAAIRQEYDEINARIQAWQMPPIRHRQRREDWEDQRRAGEAYRHGLSLYLLTALSGTTVTDPAVLDQISDHRGRLFANTLQVAESKFIATILWPLAIGGSCLVVSEHQHMLRLAMTEAGPNRLQVLTNVADLLQLVWDDPDPRAFGPYGMYYIMEKHDLCVGIA